MPSSTQQATHQTQQTQQAGPGRDRWAALALLCSSALMVILDGSVLNVALPSVQRDLGFSPAGLAWVANSYLVAFGGLLLLAGRLGDLVGRRQVFIAGLLVFSAASLACGLAWSPEVLVIARFVQGVGGALASGCSPSPGSRPPRSASSRSPAPVVPPSARWSAGS
jgi:MFS family permease